MRFLSVLLFTIVVVADVAVVVAAVVDAATIVSWIRESVQKMGREDKMMERESE